MHTEFVIGIGDASECLFCFLSKENFPQIFGSGFFKSSFSTIARQTSHCLLKFTHYAEFASLWKCNLQRNIRSATPVFLSSLSLVIFCGNEDNQVFWRAQFIGVMSRFFRKVNCHCWLQQIAKATEWFSFCSVSSVLLCVACTFAEIPELNTLNASSRKRYNSACAC